MTGIMLIFGSLLLVSILAGVLSARLGAPILLTFLIIGMLAGEEGVLGIEFNSPEISFLIGSAALVIILFDGGMRTHSDRFRVALWPAVSLATVGVALTCTILAAGIVYLFNLPWATALLIGAILSSTDAAAVFGIFQSRGMKIKQRVAATLEIESGTNDPMAVILTMTLTMALATGQELSVVSLFGQVAVQLVLGLLGGWIGGRLFIIMARKIPLSFTFFPLLAAAAAIIIYAATTSVNGSGFLAVYLMGYMIGNARLPQLVHILQVQDGLAWLSQIMMFLILGLLVTPSQLLEHAPLALMVAFILIFIARPLATIICLLPFSFPWREQVFISWVGLRGAVPIILALFPWLSGLPNQDLYFDVAFFVVLVSLLVQGWSIAPVARWLGLEVPPEAEPKQRMPLEAIPSRDALEVWEYDIDRLSPACDHTWNELRLPAPTSFVGIIREGGWIQPEENPRLTEGDALLVVARVSDMVAISRVFASGGGGPQLSEKDFFGDFTLHADLTLADVASFYPVGELKDSLATRTLAEYISYKFHRRVVVGDQLQLGHVLLTVRQLDEQGNIVSVGVKTLTVDAASES